MAQTGNIPPISVSGVCKTYRDGFKAVKKVSFDIKSGDFTVLLGLNGAGKTSMISMITGLNHISSGTIRIFGDDISRNPYRAKSHMAIMPQEINFNPFSKISDSLVFHGGYYGIPPEEVMRRAEPLLKKARLLKKIEQPVSSLSGGMKRMLMLIRCLIQKPKLLILDEPTANLDIEIRKTIWDLLQLEHGKGMTTLLTTHNLEEAQILCSNVLILHHGELVLDRSIDDAIEGLEEKFYSIHFDDHISAKHLHGFSAYHAEKRSDHKASFRISGDQDIGHLVYKLHLAGLKITNIAPSSHQLEQLLHQATL